MLGGSGVMDDFEALFILPYDTDGHPVRISRMHPITSIRLPKHPAYHP